VKFSFIAFQRTKIPRILLDSHIFYRIKQGNDLTKKHGIYVQLDHFNSVHCAQEFMHTKQSIAKAKPFLEAQQATSVSE
jgi:hypothetical protein